MLKMSLVAGNQHGLVRDCRCGYKGINFSRGFTNASQSAFNGAERFGAFKIERDGLNHIQKSGQLIKITRSILRCLRPVIQLSNNQSAQRDFLDIVCYPLRYRFVAVQKRYNDIRIQENHAKRTSLP